MAEPTAPPRLPFLRRHRRKLLIAAALVLLPIIVVWISLPTFVIHAIADAPNHGKSIAQLTTTTPEELTRLGVRAQRIEIDSPPASLSIWLRDASNGNADAPIIFLLHGIHDRKRSLLGLSEALAREGFRTVLVDVRGHGESTGEYLSYGANESRDMVRVLDAVLAGTGKTPRVGVYGASFGGSTAIPWAARDPRVVAVVTVATFSRMRDVVEYNIRHVLPLGRHLSEAWVDDVMNRAASLAGIAVADADNIQAIATSRARFLLFHGLSDTRIPFNHSIALHDAADNRSRLILLNGEGHDSIMADATGTISRETFAFLREQLASRPAPTDP